MVRSRRFLSIVAVGTAASLVGCYGIPHTSPYKATHRYYWDRKSFEYHPPINTWAEYPEMAERLREDIEREKKKTPDRTDVEDIGATILEQAGYRCITRKDLPDCKACQVCTRVEAGHADGQEMPQISGRRQAVGTITTMIYVGPGSDVRALSYWKRPPVQLKTSP
jgi:hypothetical protein